MAAPDWFTDCSSFVWKHICRIASFLVPILAATVIWYCNRIETINTEMQKSLTQIEFNVGILIDRQPGRSLAPGAVAKADE